MAEGRLERAEPKISVLCRERCWRADLGPGFCSARGCPLGFVPFLRCVRPTLEATCMACSCILLPIFPLFPISCFLQLPACVMLCFYGLRWLPWPHCPWDSHGTCMQSVPRTPGSRKPCLALLVPGSHGWPSGEPCWQWTVTEGANATLAGGQVESVLRQKPWKCLKHICSTCLTCYLFFASQRQAAWESYE